jgi:hypothetical protein
MMRRPLPQDSGSLPFALFISLIGVTLSALLIPVIVLQIGSSRIEARRVEALQAAETGVDVATTTIRTAYTGTDANGNPQGDVTKLPCNTLTGFLGNANNARYQVAIDYFSFTPSPADYLNAGGEYDTAWISANHLACHTGVPTVALLRAQGAPVDVTFSGSCTPEARCVRGLYAFTTASQAIDGGQIHVYKTVASTDLCLAATSETMTAAALTGTALTVAACDSTKRSQIFAYNSDLTIALTATRSSANPNGLCLDNRSPSASPVWFEPCAAADAATQQWVFTGNANFVGPDGSCMRVLSPNSPGSSVVHDTSQCGGSTFDNVTDFTPDSSVGTGSASSSTGQVVNYGQFSRCLEVTRSDVLWHTAGSPNPTPGDGPYLVASGCKQTTPVTWAQVWTMPGTIPTGTTGVTGQIQVTAPSTNPAQGSAAGTYCLQSPASTAALSFVAAVGCGMTHTTWTVYGYTGTAATSYVIKDDSTPTPFCLAPQTDAARTADPYQFGGGTQTAKMVVQACDGSALQKWNVPANSQPRLAIGRLGEK